ncbi:nickel pincer cofactor biosynthesis protein LarB [Ilumatobacter coccineus]|uniref:Putative phosphoribosylaminoimidazole carboxylase n=1 Tax=Ilumatobacter coccineus (strain NBRC 103263 / KCTC 29153 / YM16-304) TaxID=1313172 RepID=A0A6C7EC76_ILUCY|nr:nickel pincer cofactor biosynthesis protein LarB [Ilumatobacter coccineus]BAN03990.1 putative phosphoribosylaminoimidazole carboxylase [Ilumatobacter coccineus YM16-304]
MHQHDHQRQARVGMPEAVLCGTKSTEQVVSIVADLIAETSEPRLLTRLTDEQARELVVRHADSIDIDTLSRTAFLRGTLPRRSGRVTVVAAGTSDASVAAEAARTLEFSGIDAELIVDVGVAGLWRLEARLDDIRSADIVIAVAGMDAALVSVLGGMIGAPIIAAPTSVGYGVATGGSTALNSSLASCAQGVSVVNIDNGFGAACAAIRILNLVAQQQAQQ